jgi:Family of unknown function (DUF6184)
MNHPLRTMCGISLVTMGLLAACGGSNREPAVPGTSPGVTNAQMADSAVVGRLATARCDREQTCNNVGAGQKYVSRENCMDQMRGSLANDLNAYECPRGIDEERLDRCMAAIRNEECGHPLDTIGRMDKCRTGSLCMK